MGSLEDLRPDQRAVLQMVLQRGRSYDEIAALLSIERAAVRQRALDACERLTPDTVLPGPEHALVTDYLLGQLPDQVAEQVYAYLDAAPADREWALAISSALSSFTTRDLPHIPVGAPLLADGPEPAYDEAAPAPEPDPRAGQHPVESPPEPEPQQRPAAPRSSRRGGIILLGILAVAIIVVAVIALATGGSSKPRSTASTGTATNHSTTTTATTSTTGTTTTAQPQLLAALNLTSPNGAKQTIGVAQVIREDGKVAIAIDAQGVPPNGAHNAYALWLYNSPSKYEFVGFIQNLVGKDGKLEAGGRLPANAASYHHVLITLETQDKPKAPGEVVLSGPFREHP